MRLACLTAFGLALAPMAQAETRAFDFSDFTIVDASAGVEVIVTPGPFSVTVEEPNGRFDTLRISVKDGVLSISRRSTFWSPGADFTARVSAPAITALSASSGASLSATGLDASELALDSSSGARLMASGRCGALAADASSGARLNACDLACEQVTADASSGADIDVTASRAFAGDASSGADINVSGDPTEVRVESSSGGDISIG